MKELTPARTHPSLPFLNKSIHITTRPAPPRPQGPLGEGVFPMLWRGSGRIEASKNKLDNEKNYGPGVPSPRPPGHRSLLLSSSPLAPALPLSRRRWNVQRPVMNDRLSRLVYYNAGNQLHIPNAGRPAGN